MNTIQSKLRIALTSGTVWGMVALFAYNAIEANMGLFPAGWTGTINVLLVIITAYLHTAHVQNAATLGNTRG